MKIIKFIKIIPIALSILLLTQCDVLIKKNEEELRNQNIDEDHKMSMMHTSPNFSNTQDDFIFSVDKRHLYAFSNSSYTYITVLNTEYPGSIWEMREITSVGSTRCLAVSSDNKFFYASGSSGTIYIFKKKSNGDLVYYNSYIDTLQSVNYLMVSPNNSFLYILGTYNATFAVTCLKKDISSGLLKFNRVINISSNGDRMLFSPDARIMYISSNTYLQWYEVNYDNGEIKFKGSFAIPVYGCCISPDGKYLYVSSGTFTIDAYERNKENGNLKYKNTGSTISEVNYLQVHPDRNFLYAATGNTAASSYIEWFYIKDSGSLSMHYNLYTNSTLNLPGRMEFTRGGEFLYVLNYNNNNIAVFHIEGIR
ncbi:MAG: beta-propeller fold lactonase family protein [Spirochaetes bacterium]|nr:beta-propeller fold lactonase family protein [Spirochaetota bacterium]